tara:strand:+ start:14742 stop:14975 length:234 start_codon:yes stop_codon:yes gene_type:complete
MEYNQDEINEIRKNFLCSSENNFYTQTDSLNEIKDDDFNEMTKNINLYKLISENIIIRKKLQILENEINELKKAMKQ